MHKQLGHSSLFLLLLIFLFSFSSFSTVGSFGEKNPFTPKAFLIRYWDKAIHNDLPKPLFLLSKASPLSAVDSAAFAKLAADSALFTRLPEFCSSARLLCFPDLGPSLESHHRDSNFAVYRNKNFTNYGSGRLGGADSFKNYSDNGVINIPVNDFQLYSGGSTSRKEGFLSYGSGGNVVDQSFHFYATGATSGAGEFNRYADPASGADDLRFTSYSDHATDGRSQSFSSYTENGNDGHQSFTSYGKHGDGAITDFTSYGTATNVVVSGFSNYGEDAHAANDTFKNYAANVNNPTNTFKNYGDGGNGAADSFSNYRDEANAGADSFKSYAGNSKAARVDFAGYDKSFNLGSDQFTGYGKGAQGNDVGFKTYAKNFTFKDYAKEGVNFAGYTHVSSAPSASTAAIASGSLVKTWVEPGKFFREAMLKEGTVMPMPDIRDKTPKRSFLPRSILSKLPFSASGLKEVFKVVDGSAMDKILKESLKDCERAPSQGETKRCVGSIEDMIDFSTSVLGPDLAVRTTENVNGSNKLVMVGQVRGINGGRVTESVSCHQSLFPYLLYYCHSVPKVRVYEADLLDPNHKVKINHGVAICHLDTTSWSQSHGAFMALGSGPGEIEVCHWIFENDMTWTVAE